MKDYRHQDIERKWQKRWKQNETYRVTQDSERPKFYALDMFPYPSGAGLHVGHPLGYIASDIHARYMRHKGYNVLHPMGFDSFGLPAEQYAIQTGQHPAVTTENNIARYKEQLGKLGFNYDWSREVRTSDPDYYRWTQWIFKQLYNAWYNKESNKAEPIATLIEKFEQNGSYNVQAHVEPNWWKSLSPEAFPFFGEHFRGEFTATDWKSMNEKQRELLLMHFRLTYLADTMVNWCPALGTVLANDEVKDGRSERGGHPVVQKRMRQWSMRITAFAQRLLDGLETIDWSDHIKEMQRNWIGRSEGASIWFELDGHPEKIEVFTTRPDTIFGASFMVLAPEHELVQQITSAEYRDKVADYLQQASLKTERDRQSDVKNVTGQFTGAHAIHPFSGEKIPVWIADYVLAGYGTGAIMAVPAGDQRDWDFARKFDIDIPEIFEGVDISEQACDDKTVKLVNSGFLTGMTPEKAIRLCIEELEKAGIGQGKINYRLRDAVFSRQRYWGEPFPVYYKDDVPHLIPDDQLPVELPDVDKYLPTEDGEPPLARGRKEDWNVFEGDRMEYNTMPGWAGSSWYFLRYMDPHNQTTFADRAKIDYWKQVDLYIGGAEHATGHLLYSRFWTKFLYDLGHIGFDEPFKKMINQGMILGRSSFVYRLMIQTIHLVKEGETVRFYSQRELPQILVPKSYYDFHNEWKHFDDNQSKRINDILEKIRLKLEANPANANRKWHAQAVGVQKLHIPIDCVDNDILDVRKLGTSVSEFDNAIVVTDDNGNYHCGHEVEKMSKSKFNVQTPDELVEQFGADTLRMYEMFLGPLEQSKPWDTKGINGVYNFLRKLWRLTHEKDGAMRVTDEAPTRDELKAVHKAIKKVSEDLERHAYNTVVSTLMICVNELSDLQCSKREIIEPLAILLSPYAPHFAEELWEKLGHSKSITEQGWPEHNEGYLVENSFEYPVSFNGKTRFKLELPLGLDKTEVEKAVLADEQSAKYLEGKAPKKVIVVPGRIVNVVV
ncbi:MAG: leucine--tRNA ligase [Cryomorphaceae bacterium]|nr:MAG: leucine--tRNA ligase [Cryomorphaceae bacterium]